MTKEEFSELKRKYDLSDTDEKIRIYSSTQNLTDKQYMLLLRTFPINELERLERALD